MVDLIWLLFANGFAWFLLESNKPKEERRTSSILIIAIFSWFVFKVMHTAVISSQGTQGQALITGAIFGGVILLICIAVKGSFNKKKLTTKEE